MRGVEKNKTAKERAVLSWMIVAFAVVMLVLGNYAVRLLGAALLAAGLWYQKKRVRNRLHELTAYLEQANTGNAPVLSALGEDELSKLEDQIYKTVTYLYLTREEAVRTKNEFARNLSNIAHQIKTPITAISLCVQAMEGEEGKEGREQILRQLTRLTRLEEALLLLARLDAGTLVLKKKQTDVYTLLVLAADNLQEIFARAEVSVVIPEMGEILVSVDPDWTMEAVMNLMKNCAESCAGGCVRCFYEQNPLYTEIRIQDEGAGFDKKDLPHLFERFYRGTNAAEGGTGIGLSLAKELIERQDGVIRAGNLPEGGACFEIRFYRH